MAAIQASGDLILIAASLPQAGTPFPPPAMETGRVYGYSGLYSLPAKTPLNSTTCINSADEVHRISFTLRNYAMPVKREQFIDDGSVRVRERLYRTVELLFTNPFEHGDFTRYLSNQANLRARNLCFF